MRFYNQKVIVNYHKCEEYSSWEGDYFRYYRLVALFISPSIFMAACYTWVIIELWISTKTINELTNNM